jgi:hypothetical protein
MSQSLCSCILSFQKQALKHLEVVIVAAIVVVGVNMAFTSKI